MIDTIVLRIHNLHLYPQLKNQFYAPANKKNSYTRALVDSETAEFIREATYTPSMVFHDSNRIIAPVYRDSLNIPSSHYELAYSINTEKNFMEFNFSIPKFKYSQNIMQFINLNDQTASSQYNLLFSFISEFIKTRFLQTPKLSDIEINRIDLCYNQFFLNKNDALLYLEEQKKLLSKFARSSGNNKHSFSTSFVYVTRRYSFKIYHKGTEFKKHDLKNLMKRNPLNYDIPFLVEQADRINRYELTVRSSYLNYLFKQYFFQSKTQITNFNYQNHENVKKWKQVLALGFNKIYENYFRTSKFFTLSSPYQDLNIEQFSRYLKDHNTHIGNKDSKEFNFLDCVKFDSTMFTILYNEFWTHVKKYQLSHVTDLSTVKKKIDEINKQKKLRKKLKISTRKDERSLDKTRLLILSYMLTNGGKLRDLKEYLPSSSYYDIMNEMKQVGLSDDQIDIGIPKPKIDYQEYRAFFHMLHKF